MSECPAGIVGGECDERPSGACDADGPDLCMAYWRFAEGKQRARAEAAEKRVAELEGILCSGKHTDDMPQVCPFFVEPSGSATPFGPPTGGCKLGRSVVLPGDNSKASPLLYKIGTIDEEQARLIWCHCYSGAQFSDKPNPDFVRCWRYWRAQFAARNAAEKDAERLAADIRQACADGCKSATAEDCLECESGRVLRAHEALKGAK